MIDNLINGGVAILQYADDTIICLKDDFEKARNMKLLLYLYELMSGLKINFGKSEVIMIHGDDDKHLMYADLFNCQTGAFPLKYLGYLSTLIGYISKTGHPWRKKNEKTLHLERKLLLRVLPLL
jgi:hypothetical protein